eukprot:1160180-Pelagomonas_calceolata.AAC.1
MRVWRGRREHTCACYSWLQLGLDCGHHKAIEAKMTATNSSFQEASADGMLNSKREHASETCSHNMSNHTYMRVACAHTK